MTKFNCEIILVSKPIGSINPIELLEEGIVVIVLTKESLLKEPNRIKNSFMPHCSVTIYRDTTNPIFITKN